MLGLVVAVQQAQLARLRLHAADEVKQVLLVGAGRVATEGVDAGADVEAPAIWPFWLLCISVGLGTVRGLRPLPRLDTGGLADPMNALAALYIGKGALLALLFAGTLQRLHAWGPRRDQALLAGLAGALAWTVAVVLWEPLAFVSLLDFEPVYRVTGPFWAMHWGSAYLECFLVLGSAFALAATLRVRLWPIRLAAAALLLAAGYAVMVTCSRNGFVAWGVVLLLGLLLGLRRGVGVGVGVGGAPSGGPRRGRWSRWVAAAVLRPEGWLNAMFGVGFGRFPELHYGGSREEARAATIHLRREGDRRFLRLGPGAPTCVEQWVRPPADGMLTVQLELRSARLPAEGPAAKRADGRPELPKSVPAIAGSALLRARLHDVDHEAPVQALG